MVCFMAPRLLKTTHTVLDLNKPSAPYHGVIEIQHNVLFSFIEGTIGIGHFIQDSSRHCLNSSTLAN